MEDIYIEQHGHNLILLRPVSTDAAEWFEENVGCDSTWGGAVACEPRYVQEILRGAADAGLTSRWV